MKTLAGILAFFALAYAGCVAVAPRPATPFWTQNVGYGSMGAAYPVGHRTLILGYKYDALKAGDIAGQWVFDRATGKQSVRVHRLTRKVGDGWETRGDANARPDRDLLTRRTFAGVVVQPGLDPMAIAAASDAR